MNALYIFLIRWDIPIYFVSGLVLMAALLQLWRARYTLRRAMFSLERERGQYQQANALTLILIFGGLVAAVLYVNLRVAPTLPAELLLPPTSTPNIFATPLSSPTPLGTLALQTPRPRVTPNLVPTVTLPGNAAVLAPSPSPILIETQPPPTATLGPEEAPVASSFIPEGGGCTPAVHISSPRPNTAVFGTVEFIGSAVDPNFGFYLLEIRGEGTGGNWTSVLGSGIVTPVTNGSLGALNFTALPNGPYDVRLTVLNQSGSPIGSCLIVLTIDNP